MRFTPATLRSQDIPVKHMLDMHTYTVPCFPESYNIWEVIVRRFVARLALFYDGVAADVLSNDPNGRGYSQGQLLDLIRAHIFFTDNIRQLEDIDEEWLEFGVGALKPRLHQLFGLTTLTGAAFLRTRS